MRKLVISVLFAATGLFVMNGCDFGISSDDFEFRFKPKFIETIITGYLANSSGAPMALSAATFKITGPSASKVVNYLNEPRSVFATKGALSFALEDGTVPAVSKPIDLLVSVDAPGILPTAKRVNLTGTGKFFFDMRSVDLGNPGKGVAVVEDKLGDATTSGRVKENIVLETSGDETTGAKTMVSVGAGVVLKDASGSPLSGKLTTTVVRRSPSKPEGLAVFPGGSDAVVKSTPGSAARKTHLASGGVASVIIKDASGKTASKATTGSGTLKVDIELPAGLHNPEKGAPIKAGDSIPVWKLDHETFEWTGLGTATLKASSGGNLVVKLDLGALAGLKTGLANITLPGDINVGWDYPDNGQLTINFPGDGAPGSIAGAIEAPGLYASFLIAPGTKSHTVPAPCNIDGSKATLNVPGTSTSFEGAHGNLCTTLDISIDANAVCPNTLVFEAYGVCQGDDVQVRENNLAFFYTDRDLPDVQPRVGAVVSGLVEMCVDLGHTYRTTAFIEGEEYGLDIAIGTSADMFSVGNLSSGVSARILDELNPEGVKQVEFLLPSGVCGNLGN